MIVEIDKDTTLNFTRYKFFRNVDILKLIELNRLRCAGYLMRIECDRAVLKIFNTVPFGQQPRI